MEAAEVVELHLLAVSCERAVYEGARAGGAGVADDHVWRAALFLWLVSMMMMMGKRGTVLNLRSCSEGGDNLVVHGDIAGADRYLSPRNLGLNGLLAVLELGERARHDRHVSTGLIE